MTDLNTKKYIRPILIILLILTAFFGMVLLGAGSHGNISMKNKETTLIIYGGIAFVLSAIVNLISMQNRFFVIIGFMSFILNFISGLILAYCLFFSIRFNINGGHFPIFFLILMGVEILFAGIIIRTDLKQLNENWL